MTAPPDHSCLYQTAEERPEPIRAEIRGKIPSWLNGTLIRNGPGRFECGDTSFNHWFDGQALLHRFHIQEGNVTYSNKFVRSESYADSLNRGNSCHLEFGSFIPPDPCQNIFSRFFSRYWGQELSFDNTCVNVFPMKDKMYATTESEILFQIDPKTLDTLNKVDLSKEFPGDITISSATAHPQVTPDGSVINISVTFGMNSTYNIICIPPSSGEAGETTLAGGKVICSIPPTSGIAYFHSFCLTENYIVVTEIPLLLNVWRILSHKLFGTTYEDWLYWDPNQRARFHVVDRKNGNRVGVFTADPFFVFHHINAFEKDGKIHLDACCYRDHSLVKQMYLHNLRSPAQPGKKKFATPYVRRYELPIKDLGDAEEKPLPKGGDGRDFILLFIGMELPRINYEEHNGKPYRFVYGVRSRDAQSIFGKLVKVNVETKEFVTWEEPGGFASEPVFVKAPDGKAEDDGVILSCVINVEDQSTSLLVLDAKEFKELGRGVVEGVTPVTLHGIFQ
ncbi:carotenoid-cleaving dioxygenase, mitochondrial-like [Montipora foliosa]|uniref:carotenoid-cleaving dioxygenase, mitochondrial-like n=1 Tax=Montipora foliosa TaxID=591990 RepID=UPI0035F1C06E